MKISNEDIKLDITNGLTVHQIAEKHGITDQAIYKRLKNDDLTAFIDDLRQTEYLYLQEIKKDGLTALQRLINQNDDLTVKFKAVCFTLNRSDKLAERIAERLDETKYLIF